MFGSQAYMLDSAACISMLNEMVTWLGFPERCHFQHLLAFNVGGTGYTHETRHAPLQNGCYVTSDEEEDDGKNTNDDTNNAIMDIMEDMDMDNSLIGDNLTPSLIYYYNNYHDLPS